jgi:AraC-like DNA-binding protein
MPLSDPALLLLDAALRGVLTALLLLLALVLGRDRPRLPAARVGVALALGLALQVAGSTPSFEAWAPRLWQAPLVAVAAGNAVLFWVFARALFDDDFAPRPLHALAWAAVALLAGANCAVLVGSGLAIAPLALGLQRAAPLVFALLAMAAAASRWRADLVERRRRLRAFIVGAGALYSIAMIGARWQSPRWQLSGTMATLDVALLLAIVAVVAWRMVRLAGSDLFPAATPVPALPAMEPAAVLVPETGAEPATPSEAVPRSEAGVERTEPAPADPAPAASPEPTPEVDPAEDRLADALHRLMTAERGYRDEDLGIAQLAARLAVPEYRLRRLINQRLGHRNFNAYINGFRLQEALAALADPAKRERPVLSIALEAGFQSIGPFNRAFKAATGLTPTEFRRQKLADS